MPFIVAPESMKKYKPRLLQRILLRHVQRMVISEANDCKWIETLLERPQESVARLITDQKRKEIFEFFLKTKKNRASFAALHGLEY